MKRLLQRVLNPRVRALIGKEFNQIRRDRRLAISLILPPTLQLLLFGFALSARVSNLRLGVVDDAQSAESRELLATFGESQSFRMAANYLSVRELDRALGRGDLDAGIVIPHDYSRDLMLGRSTNVQLLLNAMNANTAAIGQGYAEGVIASYNRRYSAVAHQTAKPREAVLLQPAFLYNPGLEDSWFIATGVLGLLLILNASLVSSAAMVREREFGTIEQLMMSPTEVSEIVIAKIVPLFILLCMMMLVALGTIKVAFHVPFRGGLLLILAGGSLCVLSGISLGTVIATFSKSAQQAQLTSFFVNPPLTSLSGALNPVEAMPHWLRPLTVLNPIHHFAMIARSSMLKGSGLDTLWPNFLALFIFTLVLFSLSVWRFRKQLT